jgi:hypothetical protein
MSRFFPVFHVLSLEFNVLKVFSQRDRETERDYFVKILPLGPPPEGDS